MNNYLNSILNLDNPVLKKFHLFSMLIERDFFAASFVSSTWNNPPKGKEVAYKAREIIAFDRTMAILARKYSQ